MAGAWMVLAGLLAGTRPAWGQAPLYLADRNTTVEEISFKFANTRTFEPSRLKEQIALQEPGFVANLKAFFDWVPTIDPPTYPFDPITLQKDVARLRRFYNQQGFLNPQISYPATQLDTSSNAIHVIFSVEEGEPVIVQDAEFYGPDSTNYAATIFEGTLRDRWVNFRDQTSFRVGERYTDLTRTRIEDEVGAWLRNQGFAFARVNSSARIDSTANTADIQFYLNPGPRARFAEIEIEGNNSVSREVILRELPFKEGDVFSAHELSQGQEELFGLNMFRVVLADVPDQPRDSTVQVRIRVRESPLRYITGQVGYGAVPGFTAEGRWTHRNFYGGGRNFTVGLIAETGLPENPTFLPDFLSGTSNQFPTERRFRGSASLLQPYLFSTNLSGTFEAFFEERQSNKLPENPDRFLGLNERNFGANTSVIYEFAQFRTLTLQYSFTRTQQFIQPRDNIFTRSILGLSGNWNQTDDYLNPSQGFIVRPLVEVGSRAIGSDVQYLKLSNEAIGYLPLADRVNVAVRLFTGRLWPLSQSRTALRSTDEVRNSFFENRFDDALFYAGGNGDVRGYPVQQAGGKFLRPGTSSLSNYIYEPVGGTSKLGGNIEVRLPFPGLSSDWATAVFLDMARLGTDNFDLVPAPSIVFEGENLPDGTVVPPSEFAEDAYSTESDVLRYGAGAGVRYQTSVGYLRLDIAVPLNPDPFDIRDPEDVFDALRLGEPVSSVDPQFTQRFRIHIGIGRTF